MEVFAKDIIRLMDEWAPPYLAEKWDHSGLQIGNPERIVKKIMVALDITKENVSYAVNNQVDMILSHHPFLFKPMKEIDLSTAKGKIVENLIKHQILSFAAHTNLDTAAQGVNDALADKLNLQNRTGLVPVYSEKMYKITLYAPAMIVKVLQKKINEILKDETSHFYLLDDEDDFTEAVRLEFTVKESALNTIKDILEKDYPSAYYDIYSLVNRGTESSMGRLGELPEEMEAKDALLYVKEKLGIPCLKYSGDTNKKVRKIAVLGGAGVEFSSLADIKGADLYITGDIKYHEAQNTSADGFLVADGGHFYTERVIIPYLADRMRKEFQKRN